MSKELSIPTQADTSQGLVVVLSDKLVMEVKSLVVHADGLVVDSAVTNEEAGMILNMATKLEKSIDADRKAAKEPYAQAVKAIDATAKKATDPLIAVKAAVKSKMVVYAVKVEAENAAKMVLSGPGEVIEQTAPAKSDFTKIAEYKVFVLTGQPPVDYLCPDMDKIKAAVNAGILTNDNAPWLKISLEKRISSR